MKLKYYLRGIGIGIVITTIIFMILIAIHKNDDKQPNTSENNMESQTVASLEEDTQTSSAPKEQPLQKKEETKEPAKPKETETVKPEETESEKEEEKEVQTKNNLQEKIRIEIGGGEFSDTVCRKLEAEGLIDDAKAFNEFLVEKDYDNSIMPGIYEIPKDSTYEEIAALLTTKVE